jgi:hypothetical protein
MLTALSAECFGVRASVLYAGQLNCISRPVISCILLVKEEQQQCLTLATCMRLYPCYGHCLAYLPALFVLGSLTSASIYAVTGMGRS